MTSSSNDEPRHVRPKVRKPAIARIGADVATPIKDPGSDQAVEEVRSKMDQWMGLHEQTEQGPCASDMFVSNGMAAAIEAMPDQSYVINDETIGQELTESTNNADEESKPLKGILKTPKYSSTVPLANDPSPNNRITIQEEDHPILPEKKNKSSVFKQSFIQERDPSSVVPNQSPFQPSSSETTTSAMAVEGYEPTMDHNKRINLGGISAKAGAKQNDDEKTKNENETDEPLVFNSLADMMEMAGNLPSQDLQSDNLQMVEADLAFSCMSREEFQRELILQGMEQQAQELADMEPPTNKKEGGSKKVEWDTPNHPERTLPLSSDPSEMLDDEEEGYTESNIVADEDDSFMDDDSEGGGGLFDFMGFGGDEDESEEEPVVATTAPRAFRTIWECLSTLITHESCIYLRRTRKAHESGNGSSAHLFTATPLSDLEASRMNGFMAMVRMYMLRSLGELGQPIEMKRTAEQRLQGLLYTFNFSRPAPKLDTKQWKALTCVVVEIVLFLNRDAVGNNNQLPASANAVEMTAEEYQYLVKNVIKIYDIPDPVI